MSAPVLTCNQPEHAEHHGPAGCTVCNEVRSWPAPSAEQVAVIRRCLPPVPARARTAPGTDRRAA